MLWYCYLFQKIFGLLAANGTVEPNLLAQLGLQRAGSSFSGFRSSSLKGNDGLAHASIRGQQSRGQWRWKSGRERIYLGNIRRRCSSAMPQAKKEDSLSLSVPCERKTRKSWPEGPDKTYAYRKDLCWRGRFWSRYSIPWCRWRTRDRGMATERQRHRLIRQLPIRRRRLLPLSPSKTRQHLDRSSCPKGRQRDEELDRWKLRLKKTTTFSKFQPRCCCPSPVPQEPDNWAVVERAEGRHLAELYPVNRCNTLGHLVTTAEALQPPPNCFRR